MTDSTNPANESSPATNVDTIKLDKGAIAIVFITGAEGLGAAVYHNIVDDMPNILVPLVRGILAELHEAGGADKLIQKGVASITATATVN